MFVTACVRTAHVEGGTGLVSHVAAVSGVGRGCTAKLRLNSTLCVHFQANAKLRGALATVFM